MRQIPKPFQGMHQLPIIYLWLQSLNTNSDYNVNIIAIKDIMSAHYNTCYLKMSNALLTSPAAKNEILSVNLPQVINESKDKLTKHVQLGVSENAIEFFHSLMLLFFENMRAMSAIEVQGPFIRDLFATVYESIKNSGLIGPLNPLIKNDQSLQTLFGQIKQPLSRHFLMIVLTELHDFNSLYYLLPTIKEPIIDHALRFIYDPKGENDELHCYSANVIILKSLCSSSDIRSVKPGLILQLLESLPSRAHTLANLIKGTQSCQWILNLVYCFGLNPTLFNPVYDELNHLFRTPQPTAEIDKLEFFRHAAVSELVGFWAHHFNQNTLTIQALLNAPEFAHHLKVSFMFMLHLESMIREIENSQDPVIQMFKQRCSNILKILHMGLNQKNRAIDRNSMLLTLQNLTQFMASVFNPISERYPMSIAHLPSYAALINQLVKMVILPSAAWHIANALFEKWTEQNISRSFVIANHDDYDFIGRLCSPAKIMFCLLFAKRGQGEWVLYMLSKSKIEAADEIGQITLGLLGSEIQSNPERFSAATMAVQQFSSLPEHILYFLSLQNQQSILYHPLACLLMTLYSTNITLRFLREILYTPSLIFIKALFGMVKSKPAAWPVSDISMMMSLLNLEISNTNNTYLRQVVREIERFFRSDTAPTTALRQSLSNPPVETKSTARPLPRNTNTRHEARETRTVSKQRAKIKLKYHEILTTITTHIHLAKLRTAYSELAVTFKNLQPPQNFQLFRVHQCYQGLAVKLQVIEDGIGTLHLIKSELVNDLYSPIEEDATEDVLYQSYKDRKHHCFKSHKELWDRIESFQMHVNDYCRKYSAPRLQFRESIDTGSWRRQSSNRFSFMNDRHQVAVEPLPYLTWEHLCGIDIDLSSIHATSKSL